MKTAPPWQPFTTQAGNSGHVQHWPSMGALAAHVEVNPDLFSKPAALATLSASLLGAASHTEAARKLAAGDPNGAAEARALVDRIAVTAETTRRTWAMGVAGAFPVVPAYLSGNPTNMRRRVSVRTESAPLRIWLGLTTSQGTERSAMRGRAIGAMALAIALSSHRHVTVMGFIGMGGAKGGANFVTVPLPVDSDMAGVFGALADPVMARYTGFHLHVINGGSGMIPWPWGQRPRMSETGDATMNPNVRDAIGAGPDDLILNGAHYDDSDLIVSNPTEWVRRMLAQHGALADTEEAA